MSDHLALTLPDGLVEAIARRVADLLSEKPQPASPASPWMDFEAARAYLGFSRDALYKLTAAQAVPFRRKVGGQGLRFHQGELDGWMDQAYPRVDRAG